MAFIGSFIPPKLTTTERDAITSPKLGEVIYNSTTKKLNQWDGVEWISYITSGTGGDSFTFGNIWAVNTLINC